MYNKIFTKILDSSLWLYSHPTRIVWITLIASMDEDGMCQFASIGNLARRAIVTLEEATQAMACLEAPDPDSFNPENDGRRVERVPGGWLVLNAKYYREIVSREETKRLNRERVARFRAKKDTGNPQKSQPVTPKPLQNGPGNDPVMQSEAEAYTAEQAPLPPVGGAKLNTFRSAWSGVMQDLHTVLVNPSLSPRTAARLLGDEDWAMYFEDMELVALGEPPGASVIIRCGNPKVAQVGLEKYANRIRKSMDKYFGAVVPVVLEERKRR